MTPFESAVGGDIAHAKKLRGNANNARLALNTIKAKLQNTKEERIAGMQNELNLSESDFNQAVMLAQNAMRVVLESVLSESS